ncbi:hypothetical protein JKP88DRAFT_249173 [Tribonema minus]|uniref:Uncharacterized protein n=1 Tax=Tribonema minus TaxID=303371 RepID=A0A835YUT3_9STRA|nr:hypothetical protein JKP88DRAFT_249173 [Tribonema minus]
MYPKKERMLSGSPINTIPQHMLSLFAHVLVQTSAPPLDAGGAAAASATSSGTNGAAANATPSCNGSGGSNVAEQAAFLETTLGLTQLDWSRLGDFCCRLQQLVNSRAAAAAALPSSAPQKLPVSAQICCTDVTPGPPSWRQPDTRGLPKVTPKDEHQKHTAAQGEKQGGVLVRVADAAAAAGAQPASGDKRASCMRELRCGQDDHRAKPDPELKQGRDVASAAAGAAEAKPAAPQQASRQPAAAAAAPPAAAAAPAAAPVRYPARIRTKARPPSISESGAANSAAAPDNCGSSSAGSGSHGAAHQRGRRRASGAASPPPDAAVPPPPAFSPPHAAPRLHGAAAAGGADGDGAFEARLQLPAQDHRYAARTSVGGRNYTDEQLRQLQLIEAEVVARATPGDHAAFNLPRQARTLALTNMFKYIALRGAARLHAMAVARGLEGRTGRHSNFYDGKIDTRIVAVVKHDMDDAAATASRKFSKVLLSLLAEGCGDPSCDWSYATFASDNINRLQGLHNILWPLRPHTCKHPLRMPPLCFRKGTLGSMY